MYPIFLLLVATLPSALGQCTTSQCQEQGHEPPRWENGAVYLESLLAQTSDRMLKAVQEALETRLTAQTAALEGRLETRLAAQTASLETRLAAQTATLQEKIASLEVRLAASCSARYIGDLVSAFQNASSQMAECCGRPVATATPTVRPSTTPTTTPSTTPTVRPSTTPTVRPSTTSTVTPSTTPTNTPSTTPTATPSPTTTPSTTPTTTTRPTTTPTDCFTLSPTGTPRSVVFLRRQDGSVDFYRDWAAYKCGFGNQSGEFWLGLDNLNNLTTRHNYSLRVDLEDWEGPTLWAEYSTFRVAGEESGYVLTVTGFNSASTAGDSMSYNSGERFSTRDRDNDMWSGNCADRCQGAWWYGGCSYANPTGPYKPTGYRGSQGIFWTRAYRDRRSFKRITLTLVNT